MKINSDVLVLAPVDIDYNGLYCIYPRAFQKRSQPQQLTVCRSLHAEALHANMSERLAQDPYVVAKERFEPTTLRSKGIESTNAPPRLVYSYQSCGMVCLMIVNFKPLDLHCPVMRA